MSDLILVDGDAVNFDSAFTPAVVIVKPGKLSAGGEALLNGKKVCVAGDEKNVSVPGCQYTSPPFVTKPGTGTLKIMSLTTGQIALNSKSGNKALLLKGNKFIAKFEVQEPAQFIPPTPAPVQNDPITMYMGQGSFETTNQKFKGS